MDKGSSTFAKAMAMDEERLRDFIDYCKQCESPEEVMDECERLLTMQDLEIAADATYVSNSWLLAYLIDNLNIFSFFPINLKIMPPKKEILNFSYLIYDIAYIEMVKNS